MLVIVPCPGFLDIFSLNAWLIDIFLSCSYMAGPGKKGKCPMRPTRGAEIPNAAEAREKIGEQVMKIDFAMYLYLHFFIPLVLNN